MPRKESETVAQGNGPVPHQEEFGSGQPPLVGVHRKIEELLDRRWMAEERRLKDQRVASLEQDAQQPRLAMEADGQANTKIRECTEGAVTVVQAMHGNSFSASRVDPDPKTTSTSFGVKAEPPALACRDDVVVKNGAAALKPREMRSSTAAGGLLPTGETSTATKTTFDYSTLWFCQTEETNLRIPIVYVSYDNSFFWENNNLPAAPSCRRAIETKSGQNRMFDPGGSQGRLRACPFLRTWRALLCGEAMRVRATGGDLQCFFGWKKVRGISFSGARYKQLYRRFTVVKRI